MNLNNQTKLLWFGDLVNESGFGRIGNEVTRRLAMRGWPLLGASIPYVGYPQHSLPFYVWGMGGVDIWNRVTAMVNETQPGVIVCCQDFPYAQTLFQGCQIDWSTTKLIIVTPIDGTPIHPEWLRMVDLADTTMVISRFGVEAMRLSGKPVELLHPGVDSNAFYPAESREEVAALRAKLGITPDAFVMGSFMMNQGRKAVPEVLELFFEFAREKPNAVLYMDMDKASPAGWDIPSVLGQMGVDGSRVKYREDAFAAGIMDLRDRMILCDVTCQLAHREGFGLPNLESQACKVPPMVIDWCSGSEIAGGERGLLVRRIDYMSRGTWGGARDAFPDMTNALAQLNRVYGNRDELSRIASAGYEWAIKNTWDAATDQFEAVLKQVVAQQRKEREAHEPQSSVNIPAPGLSDTRGPGHGIDLSASLQQLPGGDALPGVAAGNNGSEPDGDHSIGRLQPAVQLAGAAPAGSDPGAAKPAKPRIRGQRQHNGAASEGGVSPDPEPGREGGSDSQ
jgi:hypothetical protein